MTRNEAAKIIARAENDAIAQDDDVYQITEESKYTAADVDDDLAYDWMVAAGNHNDLEMVSVCKAFLGRNG